MSTFQPWSTPGCTSCGSPATISLDGFHGRRCAAHEPTLDWSLYARLNGDGPAYLRTFLPARYDRGVAAELVDDGRPWAAFAYLRTWLGREIDERFGGLS